MLGLLVTGLLLVAAGFVVIKYGVAILTAGLTTLGAFFAGCKAKWRH